MEQDYEHVEHTEGRGRHDKEVDRDEVGDVVLEERSPSLRRRPRPTGHEPGDGALRDIEPELAQFAVDARRAPERIGERHHADELRKLGADAWSTRSPASGLPGPQGATALPVPENHGLGGNDMERLAPPCPTAREAHPESAIEASEPRSRRAAAEQGELLSQREVLECEIRAGPEGGAHGTQ
jgi:hypothetical protein